MASLNRRALGIKVATSAAAVAAISPIQVALAGGGGGGTYGAAGLVDALSGPGPLTVFAPTDEAFAKLGKATIDSVLADKALLTKILTYHVVSGQVKAADVVKVTSAKTLQGGDVKVSVVGGAVKINDATVVVADVLATNGVIHVIDTVLMPS
ncbi:MAG: fasciclin domain-containing protein [Proteobacteria bacterium]|nr:fasciclin domain-containing protein [Pseudomonadota bacterium]